MKKSLLTVITIISILLAFMLPASATPVRFVDDAGLVDTAANTDLQTKLDLLSQSLQFDIVIVTVNDTQGSTSMEYADDYFDYNGYGFGENRDGVLLLVDMESSEIWISTSGYGITAFTDAGIDYILDRITPYISDGDYAYAFNLFAEDCDQFVTQARTGEPFDVDTLPKSPFNFVTSLLVALGIGLVFAFIVVGSMKSKLKSVARANAAANYQRQGSMNIVNSTEYFLYSHVDRTKKSSESSGGSSTHTSSSGRTHGGGGRSF